MGEQNQKRRPRRYKLYDKLKITPRQVDVFLYACIGLVVLCVLFGVVMR